MSDMLNPLEEIFDLNGDGKLDSIEFGVMMEVINDEEKDISLHRDYNYYDECLM